MLNSTELRLKNIFLDICKTVETDGSSVQVSFSTPLKKSSIMLNRDTSVNPALPTSVVDTPVEFALTTVKTPVFSAGILKKWSEDDTMTKVKEIESLLGDVTGGMFLDLLAKQAVENEKFFQISGATRPNGIYPSLSNATKVDSAIRKTFTRADLVRLSEWFDTEKVPIGEISELSKARVLILPSRFYGDLTSLPEFSDARKDGLLDSSYTGEIGIAMGWIIINRGLCPVFKSAVANDIAPTNQINISTLDRGDDAFVANSRECGIAFYPPFVGIGVGPVSIIYDTDDQYGMQVKGSTRFNLGLSSKTAVGVHVIVE